MRQGGIELPYHTHHALVAQVLKGEIHQVEVHALQVHARRGGYLATFGRCIGEPGNGIIGREAIELFYRLHFANIGE